MIYEARFENTEQALCSRWQPTTWVVVKEKDGSSEYRGKQSIVEHTRGVDTDENRAVLHAES